MSFARIRELALVCLLLHARQVRAEGSEAKALPSDTSWALPGIVHVGVPGLAPRRLALAGTAGYGYTESQGTGDGAHHRISGTAAVGVAPISALELALRFDGRYDLHPDDGKGAHGSGVGDPRLLVRYGAKAGSSMRLGVEAGAWFPGKDAPSLALDATTIDGKVLAAYAPDGGPIVGLSAGFRLDHSYKAAPDLTRLRPGDRLALGLSDSNAALVGLGVAYPAGKTEILGEVSADLLVGSKAPSLGKSPMRVDLGVRQHLSNAFSFDAIAEVSPSGRPGLAPTDPLVPVEPRFSLMLGLRYRLPFDAPPPAAQHEEAQPDTTAKPIVAETPKTGPFQIRLVTEDGTPVPEATVAFKVGEETKPAENKGNGVYAGDALPASKVTVTVTAEGYAPLEESVDVPSAQTAPLDVTLKGLAPAGQLRGLIRSFAGKGLGATIHVEPGETEAKTDAQGAFTLDLAPGDYEISIRATGFKEQHRKVHVDKNGVTVINAELFEGK